MGSLVVVPVNNVQVDNPITRALDCANSLTCLRLLGEGRMTAVDKMIHLYNFFFFSYTICACWLSSAARGEPLLCAVEIKELLY